MTFMNLSGELILSLHRSTDDATSNDDSPLATDGLASDLTSAPEGTEPD